MLLITCRRCRWLPLSLLAALACLAAVDEPQRERSVDHGWRGRLGPYPLIVVHGDAGQRGRAMGQLAAPEIVAVIDRYLMPRLERLGGFQGTLDRVLAHTRFSAGAEAEIDGLLVGINETLPPARRRIAGRPLQREHLLIAAIAPDFIGMACSSVATWGPRSRDGGPLIGRNLDYPADASMLAAQAIIVIHPTEPGLAMSVTVGWCGLAGTVTGLNQHGVFAAVHDVAVPAPQPPWQPRAAAIAEVLSQATNRQQAAIGFQNRRSAIGSNLLLADDNDAVVLEWLPSLRQPLLRSGNHHALVCTNHALAAEGPGQGDSQRRWLRLEDWLGQAEGPLRSEDLRQALAAVSHANTVHSVIAQPQARRLEVALATRRGRPATDGPWVTVDLRRFLEPLPAPTP